MGSEGITTLNEYNEAGGTALVCDDKQAAEIASVLKGLKYAVETSASAADTFEKMKFNHYDVIVMSETFGGSVPDNNEALKHIQNMPMSTRRHIFFALIGQNVKTQDNGMAFSKSANVVINEKDLPNLAAILKKSIADNELFYKVYKESLVKMGKR